MTQKRNKLSEATSPYLQQHAHNPVDWHEWGNEALEKAQRENKPLIISIGYAACHWCHVMARKSFMNESIAALMNENFVCIKIDREERPDIDMIYMDAAQILTGRGGWPLNAFALPDGKPFYAGTYFTPNQWIDALTQISKLYTNNYTKIKEQAESLTQGIQKHSFITIPHTTNELFTQETYTTLFDSWKHEIDYTHGGLNKAPKFPLPVAWEFLLQNYALTQNTEAYNAVEVTLQNILKGGIYDLVGGGFCRYATDIAWKIPHFEKMLYDNGQLISLYAHAYQISKNNDYALAINQTLESIEREFLDVSGGFYASLNADSEGVEGKFYVWSKKEIQELLQESDFKIIQDFYSISRSGNWEDGTNIIWSEKSKIEFAESHKIQIDELNSVLNRTHKILFDEREKRIRPTTDTKIITSWNALMLQGYIDSYKALGNEHYLQMATKNAAFLISNMLDDDGKVWRIQNQISGFLDDYALLAQALISMYEITFDLSYLEKAKHIADYTIQNFYDTETGFFYYVSEKSEQLVAKKYELTDNVIPASNSILGIVLFKISLFFDEEKYKIISATMLSRVQENIGAYGAYHANWGILYGLHSYGLTEICITGTQALEKLSALQKHHLPFVLFAGGTEENIPLLQSKVIAKSTKIYVCKNNTCSLVSEHVEDILKEINNMS